jgi:tricorn protease interacting factor F2/3
MSTYLVFFGVGEFEFTVNQKDQRVRVATLPGMQEFARFGVEFGRKSLEFSESYYGIDYPLAKMDLIAIPDFAFGAMENWGAITFRENLLLHYPRVTSKSGEERICEVIAHEIAHQWFGNLVTPSDWRYLWLNESFATYFGFGVVNHYYPHWKTWQQFLFSMTASALVRDGLHETFAIEIPGGEHVVINASTAPIIYNKGGSILRQIQGYIGDENFKEGLRHYLKTYEYECAASHHLWEAFETVSRQPVSAMMQNWIEQPGYPLVTVNRRGRQLRLRQERFTYLPNDFDQTWQIPVHICLFLNNGTVKQTSLLLSEYEQTIDLEDDVRAYKVNDRQTGFYRVRYQDTENVAELGKLVQQKLLSPEDRWGIQNDIYALVRSGRASLRLYLEFLKTYDQEDAYLPLVSIAENLFSAYIAVNRNVRNEITAFATPKFEALLSRIGYDPAPDEDHPTALLRDRVIWYAALYGLQPARDFVSRQFSALMNGEALHPDIMKSVMQAGALTGDGQVFNWFDQRLQTSPVEHERMNILTAIGCFKDPHVIKKVQQYLLDNVPARNQFIPVVAMCENPHAVGLVWDWYVSNLDRIEQFHPMLYERVIAAIIPSAGIDRPEEVKAFFDRYLSRKDTARDVINLSLERLDINLRMRNNMNDE